MRLRSQGVSGQLSIDVGLRWGVALQIRQFGGQDSLQVKTFRELDEEQRKIDAIPRGVRWPWVAVNIPVAAFAIYAHFSFEIAPSWIGLIVTNILGLVAIVSFFKANYNGNWLARNYTKYPEALWTNDRRIVFGGAVLAYCFYNVFSVWQFLL